ncbi:MAG: UDP-N-acetylmuramate dehydrogenase [Rhodobacteraceae bacterium]|nr:UDP-N-acetylmuramate dehydrogenase [Paracoccaceae bacterium]
MSRHLPRSALPDCRGRLTARVNLSNYSWMRVGGPADWLFQPADTEDLAKFLARLDRGIPVFVMGVGSNLIIRDGGIRGVVVRLGRPFMKLRFDGNAAISGAAMLDARVAVAAAARGLDLAFLKTIPGSMGGAVRMNAGCYGSYIADHFESATVVLRSGRVCTLGRQQMGFAYRHSDLPADAVVTEVRLRGERRPEAEILNRMKAFERTRNDTQPVKTRTAGSTFRNPAGRSSTGDDDDSHELKAWSLIDRAGQRGRRLGGAQMSTQHPNFMINLGTATASELEELGESVRQAVLSEFNILLEWEVVRIGDSGTGNSDAAPDASASAPA